MARSKQSQIAVIQKQIAALKLKQKVLLKKSSTKALSQIVSLMTKNDISISEIRTAISQQKSTSKTTNKKISSKKSVVAPKYRDPANPDQTWSGRGRAPLWVQQLKSAGQLDAAIIK